VGHIPTSPCSYLVVLSACNMIRLVNEVLYESFCGTGTNNGGMCLGIVSCGETLYILADLDDENAGIVGT